MLPTIRAGVHQHAVLTILMCFAWHAILTAIFTCIPVFWYFQQSHAKQLFVGWRVGEHPRTLLRKLIGGSR